MKPYLIAEIGINHNQDMQIIKKLIDASFAIGWDCVKFQKKTPNLCVPEEQKYKLKSTPWGVMTYLDYKNKLELKIDDYIFINKYCKSKPIDWSASIWDLQSLDFMIKYFENDIPFIKIPSAKLTDFELLTIAAQTGKPIYLSTGMSTLDEIDTAVQILEIHASNFVLFHCNSSYPAPSNELNLRLIPFYKKRYGCTVGYSGHEYSIEPTVIAVALGADYIERHITLNHNMWGTDQKASLEISAMDTLKHRIDDAVVALGDGVKAITLSEVEVRKKLRGDL